MAEPEKPSFFGRSLRILDGDLLLVEGDLAQVSGWHNLIQAIRVIIATPLGTDIFQVNYGFDLLGILSQPNSARATRELIRLNLVKSLSFDDRIREITDLVFVEGLPRQWQATVTLQTIPQGEVTLTLQGAGV